MSFQAGQHDASAEQVDGTDEVLGPAVAQEDPAKDVKDVVPVIGQGERVDDGVEVDDEKRDDKGDGHAAGLAEELFDGGGGRDAGAPSSGHVRVRGDQGEWVLVQ